MIADYPLLVIYDTKTWQKLSVQPLMPDGLSNDYMFSPDLSLLAICDIQLPDTAVKIWNTATGELVQTLEGEWGRCGGLRFSPDGRLLLRFDEHGAGPVIWEVAGWKLIQANANLTTFVGSGDEYMGGMDFSNDGASVLVDTFRRLTLYALPPGTASTPYVWAPVASPASNATSGPMATIPVMSCDVVVTGWYNLHVQPCLAPSRVSAGDSDGAAVMIWMKDSNFMGVIFDIPPFLQKKLKPGKYVIGDATDGNDGYKIVAGFDYYDPATRANDTFFSYDGGTITFTQTGKYISGSFSFGARTEESLLAPGNGGRQINVEGSFENIPFTPVNMP
jgi:hypothetical protein